MPPEVISLGRRRCIGSHVRLCATILCFFSVPCSLFQEHVVREALNICTINNIIVFTHKHARVQTHFACLVLKMTALFLKQGGQGVSAGKNSPPKKNLKT